jgi:hypothetical protein
LSWDAAADLEALPTLELLLDENDIKERYLREVME